MDNYLRISKASDLKDPKDRFLYRLLEILPGFLSWGTIAFMVLSSYFFPTFAAIFILVFIIFWLFRAFYFIFHLFAGYKKMKENEKIDWIKRLEELDPKSYSLPVKEWKEIYHLIVIPTYKEPLEILREAFNSLCYSDYPKDRMIVVLGCEKRRGREAEKIAQAIEKEYQDRFFKLLITWHPDSSDEIAGKSANETFAVRQVKREVIDSLGIPYENIIFSPFDADTVVYPKYFSCLTFKYLTITNPTHCSFQPIPIYTNNIWKAPGISRVFSFSSSFWQIMNQERPEKLITFSSHSMSFKALIDVDFKDPRVVSDDSRIFWQCFLKYDGNYRVLPLFYPVCMDANTAETLGKTLVNLYKQQRRWGYGASEIAFFLFGFLKNKKIPFSKKLDLGLEIIEGHWAWATASFLIFFMGWLPLALGGPRFSHTMLSYSLPKMVSRISTVANIGLITSAYLGITLLPPKPPEYGRFKFVLLALEWALLPFVMLFLSALPSLDAQTRLLFGRYMGFWATDKVRK